MTQHKRATQRRQRRRRATNYFVRQFKKEVDEFVADIRAYRQAILAGKSFEEALLGHHEEEEHDDA